MKDEIATTAPLTEEAVTYYLLKGENTGSFCHTKCIEESIDFLVKYVDEKYKENASVEELGIAETARYALACDAIRANVTYNFSPNRFDAYLKYAYNHGFLTYDDYIRVWDVAMYIATIHYPFLPKR